MALTTEGQGAAGGKWFQTEMIPALFQIFINLFYGKQPGQGLLVESDGAYLRLNLLVQSLPVFATQRGGGHQRLNGIKAQIHLFGKQYPH